MGSSRFDPVSYSSYSASVASKSRAAVFSHTGGCHDDLNPTKFKMRESRDSIENPNSTPVMIGVDVTGSMGELAELIVKKQLGIIVPGIYDKKPIPDPHILLAAIGDGYCDQAPIQATQFEADVCLVKQIEKIWLEGSGGGNNGESYPLLWALAQYKTSCDAIEKAGRKGYIFTVGDERALPIITREQMQRFLDVTEEADIQIDDLLKTVSLNWNVFHLVVPTHATTLQQADKAWRDLLGERAVMCPDTSRLGELIVSLMQVNEGQDPEEVVAGWGGETGLALRDTLGSVATLARSSTRKPQVEQV